MSSTTDQIRILHVDDDPEFAALVADVLEREGDQFTVETTTSTDEALSRLGNGDVDCVLSDYDMPGRNGVELLEAVREIDPDLPFILFTGKGSEEVASEAISAGVSDYLQKGTGTEQYELLANRVRAHVDRTRTQRERKRQLRAIETAREGISILDDEGRFVYVNEAYAELYGYEPGEMIGRHWELLYPDDEVAEIREDVLPTVEAEGWWRGETTGLRADGSTFVEDHTLASTDEGGLVCTVRDVTERRERERELERSTALLSTLFDTLPFGVLAEDESREVMAANEKLFDLFELPGSREELVGTDCRRAAEEVSEAFLDPDGFVERIDELVTNRKPVDDEELELADGRTFARSYRPIEFPDGAGHLWTYRDVTDRKDRERDLERYETLLDILPDSVVVTDLEGTITDVYGRESVSGYTTGELTGRDASTVMPSETVERVETIAAELITNDDLEAATYETEIRSKDGEETPCEVHIAPLPSDEDGRIPGTISVLRDISERKERERELERSRELLRHTEQLADVGGWEADVETGKQRWTDGTYAIHDLDPDSKFEPTVEAGVEFYHPDDRDRIEAAVERCMETGDRFDEELRILTAEDRLRWIRATGEAVEEDGDIVAIRGAIQDITEHKEYETELEQQNERLEEFASIVSHDLRNPLNVAAGRLELAREDCESEHIDDVARALDRIETLVADLLAVARAGATVRDPEPVELATLCEDCWRNVPTEHATLEVDADGTIRADSSRLRQLFENLYRNSIEHGSRRPDPQTREEVTVRIGLLENERGFYVEDDGDGLPEDERDRVFESGYSTTDEGTGFGLSIVEEIVEAHGWEIRATESDDGGARFEISGVDVER